MAFGEREEVAADLLGWAVTAVEFVLSVAFAEAQAALKHPDLLVDEGVGLGYSPVSPGAATAPPSRA